LGSFYTNITLKGPTKDAVLAVLRKRNRRAFVSHTHDPFTVVYDLEAESQDEEVLCYVAELLSRELACPALAVLNHDDDVLVYHLYSHGEKADSYNSVPGYFSGLPTPSSGGNAAVLIEAFHADCDPEMLSAILHSRADAGEGQSDAQQFLTAGFGQWIARILGNPSLVAQLLTDRPSDEALDEVEKMRDEIFSGSPQPTSCGTLPALDDKYLFALDRHRDLVEALGLPLDAVGGGYNGIESGMYPEGFDKDDFVHT
jgi:hypothetical protein